MNVSNFQLFSNPILPFRIFNKSWNQKLEAKRAAEFEHEKASRAKAQEDYATWKTQRDIRLNAKKESNRSEEQVLLEALESEVRIP